jgi:hypothetical protein
MPLAIDHILSVVNLIGCSIGMSPPRYQNNSLPDFLSPSFLSRAA